MASQQVPDGKADERGRETVVNIDGVTKRYGSLTAVDDVTIPIRDGEFLTSGWSSRAWLSFPT
jgi:hypothetical protein